MSLIRLEKISKSFAGEPVLTDIDLRVEEGERIGLIGRNGTGKSTIFRLITGETDPDSGNIDRMKRASYASLAQIHRVDESATIFDMVLHSFDDLLKQELALTKLEEQMADGDESILDEYSVLQDQFMLRGGYDFRTRIKQVLQGLGFHTDEFDLPFSALSGGQRTRIMLALVLLQDADLLLLDEPENHLDLEAREWLEKYLQDCQKAVIIISHDRQMLNSVVQRVVELEWGEIRSYTGNYDQYLAAKALIREQQQKDFDSQIEFIRKEQAWIDRFRYKNTKAKQVQSRVKRLEKLERVVAPDADAAVATFKLGEVVRSGAIVLDAKELGMGYGDITLYEDVRFQVQRGERVGIIGPNGCGKSTLLNQLAGKHTGLAGEVVLGHKVSLGVYEQNHESLNASNDILTELQACLPKWKTEQIRAYLGRFLFTGDDVFKTIDTLSGGERSRVAMAKLIASGHNVILLDEPTNHLDIVSREALEESLRDYPGTIIMVSHDRALIDHLVEKLVIMENGKTTVHLGNYSSYRWKNAHTESEEEKSTEEVLQIRRGEKKTVDKKAQTDRKADQRIARQQQRKLEQIEEDIEQMEELVGSYDAKLSQIDPLDYTATQNLKDEYDGLKADLQELYSAWEELT